jgi:integrase
MANNVLREFKRHLKWAGIKPNGSLAIHTLRKCCGQNWADRIPNPNVVKELMGHSSLATTMKFYNQVSAEHRAEAAALIDDLLTSTSNVETTDHEKTDARLTPRGNLRQHQDKGQF